MAERAPKRLDAAALREYALRVLSGRAYSVGELRQKLAGRAAHAADIAPLIARLKEAGYLDDQKYAESFSNSRLENQGFGKMRVLRELRQRRVAPSVAEREAAATYRGTDEAQLVEDFLRRKFRATPLAAYLAEPRHLASAYRKLRLAGFGASASLGVLKRFAREPELLDSLEEMEDGLPDASGRDPSSGEPLE
ncbi:MAG: regulatory protein RecX [Bryobacteraceae bacterium]